MAKLTEEEKEVLYRAHEIRERLRAEALEAGEISLKEAEQQAKEELKETFGPGASHEEDTERFSESMLSQELETEAYAENNTREQKKITKKDKKRVNREIKKAKKHAAKDRRKHSGKKSSFLSSFFKVLLIALIVLALIATVSYAGIRVLISTTNYQPYTTSYVRASDVVSDKMVTNILLIGTDNRQATDASRSDAMIVLSINRKKGKLVMTSILRDSYVNIPGYGQNRINHAYQMGGAALLIQTIEENFKIGIDYYMQVDFYSFIEVVDAFGGVEIDVIPEELVYINGYVSEINRYEGYGEGYNFLNEAGRQNLNGSQALAYSRIRYIGTDFGRTDRQRTVLNALIKKAKTNPFAVVKACRNVLPDLTTNINDGTMSKFLFGAPLYMFYEMTQCRVPIDGCWWNDLTGSGQEVLGIDFNANNAQLRSAIYD